jgi:DNA-binding protein H-NS
VLKEQLQTVIRDNHILKRAVSIQHERQSEHENCTQEISQLKQLISQYQEQVRTLEVISIDFQSFNYWTSLDDLTGCLFFI